jgi:hypothetical protein
MLRFNDKGLSDPFYTRQMSDGTLELFAYLLLLEDPTSPSFLYIETPENGLCHKLPETFANEFRQCATSRYRNLPATMRFVKIPVGHGMEPINFWGFATEPGDVVESRKA